jgi:hypothetical protein
LLMCHALLILVLNLGFLFLTFLVIAQDLNAHLLLLRLKLSSFLLQILRSKLFLLDGLIQAKCLLSLLSYNFLIN